MPPRYSKPKATPEQMVPVEGSIDEILDPKLLENFNGYAVVRLNGRLVKGVFPFLDMNFRYRFRCYAQRAGHSDMVEYIISRPDDPPFEPLPLNRIRLKAIFRQHLGLSELAAEAMVTELTMDPQLVGVNFESFPPSDLLNRLKPTPAWIEKLTQDSFYFRYPFIEFLQRFWSPVELSTYTVAQLLEIGREFKENPENFAYEFKNKFRLPELPIDRVETAMRMLQLPIPPPMKMRNLIFQHCRKLSEKRGLLCYDYTQIRETNLPIEPALEAKLVQRYAVTLGPNMKEDRYFMMPIWRSLQNVLHTIARLISTPVDPSLFLARPRKVGEPGVSLTDRQSSIVTLSRQCGLMFIDAPGGVGKTFTALRIAALSKRKQVLACAHYGRVASMLRKTEGWGSGYTIHRLAQLIQRNTKMGQRLQSNAKVVFVDEGSHLTLELLALLFMLFPDAKRFIFLGDMYQMRPPSGIPIYEALVEFYKDTPLVQTLTENMRVDRENAQQAATLIANNLKIRSGRVDLEFTRELRPDAALIIWPRARIPLEMEGEGPGRRDARVKLIKQTLAPLVKYLGFSTDVQYVSLRHDTIQDLNEALAELRDEFQKTQSNTRIYRAGDKVTFSKNYYPPREQMLPKDADKRKAMLLSPEYRMRTTQVNNNEICIVDSIWDIDPLTGIETAVQSTIDLKPSNVHQRVIRFKGGGQVNLGTISLGNIFPGLVSTISSIQGSQTKIVVGFLDRRDVVVNNPKYGSLMKRDTIYTLHSRAKQQVVLVCEAIYNSLQNTDVGTVIKHVRPPPDLSIHRFLPRYEGPSANEMLGRMKPEAEPVEQNESDSDSEDLAD